MPIRFSRRAVRRGHRHRWPSAHCARLGASGIRDRSRGDAPSERQGQEAPGLITGRRVPCLTQSTEQALWGPSGPLDLADGPDPQAELGQKSP